MNWFNTPYKRWGLALTLGYLLMQSGITYLYYHPPANALEITHALTTALPWIAGVESIAKLSVVGERLSFTLAIAHLPFVVLGGLAFARELIFKRLSGADRSKWQEALACLGLIGVLVILHYFGYWLKSSWKNHIQIIQTWMATFSPFLIGISFFGFLFRLKQFFIKK